jgi:hypothetical protein
VTPPTKEPTGLGDVGDPAQAPRADLEGIAQEVGKIEQKLLLMMGPLQQLEDISQGLGQLLEPEQPPAYQFPAGSYQLQPVCDFSGEGQLIEPVVVNWPGGEGEFLELRHRVDALARLIQAHKNLKQPVCHKSPPVGDEVTVNFWEAT